MKIGISSPAFALEPFLKVLDSVAPNFKLWELVADLNQLLPNIAEEFKQVTPSYDLEYSIHAPFNDLNLAALNPKLCKLAFEYIKKTIIVAADLGIELITIHPGHLCPSGIYAVDKVIDTNLRSLQKINKFAADYNVTIALENMPIKYWTLGNTAYEIMEMIENTEFGICFDVGHAFIVGELENFLNNANLFSNIHIHDNCGRRDEHLVLGEGNIDLPYVIEKILNEYSGDFIIESNNLEEGIKSKAILQKLLDKK